MRLKRVIVLAIILVCAGAGLEAQPRQFGLGLVLIDPSGLTAKAPFNLFFEVAPAFNFARARVSGAVGLRYIFGS